MTIFRVSSQSLTALTEKAILLCLIVYIPMPGNSPNIIVSKAQGL